MPNYSAFTPYGDYGPHYDLNTSNPMGATQALGGGSALNAGDWYQTVNWPAEMAAGQKRSTPTPFGGSSAQLNSATGLYSNSVTGMPFNGYDAATGRHYVNGKPVTEPVPYSGGAEINPNDPNQRYQAVNIQKNPEVSPVIQQLTDQLTKTASDSLKNFDEYKSAFTDALGAAQAKSKAATDIAPISANLTALQQKYSSDLDTSKAQAQTLNTNTQNTLNSLVAQGQDITGPQTDAAIAAAMKYQGDILQNNVSRYKLGTGTPTGVGSAEQAQLVKGAAAIAVPMKQFQLSQRQNQLQSIAYPAATYMANAETNRIQNFNPMVAAQQFQTGTATAETIQQLAMTTANMAYQDAVRYMQAMGVPQQVQQQILSGNIGQAQAVNQLLSGSRYQGLQDVLGANVTPAQNFQFTAPGYPAASRYTPQGQQAQTATGTLAGAGNAPKQVSPQGQGQESWFYNPDDGVYYDRATGLPYAESTPSGAGPGGTGQPADMTGNPNGYAYPTINETGPGGTGQPADMTGNPNGYAYPTINETGPVNGPEWQYQWQDAQQ